MHKGVTHVCSFDYIFQDGSTALHAAAMGGHEDTVQSLLRHGIEPSTKNQCMISIFNLMQPLIARLAFWI